MKDQRITVVFKSKKGKAGSARKSLVYRVRGSGTAYLFLCGCGIGRGCHTAGAVLFCLCAACCVFHACGAVGFEYTSWISSPAW